MLQNIGGFCFLQLAVVYSVSTKEIGLEGLQGHSAYLKVTKISNYIVDNPIQLLVIIATYFYTAVKMNSILLSDTLLPSYQSTCSHDHMKS